MAAGAFNLTAQINLRGPTNVKKIIADIRREVSTISVDISPRINTSVIKNIKDLNRSFRDFNTTLAITTANTRVTARALNDLAKSVNAIGSKKLQTDLNNATRASADLSKKTRDVSDAAVAASSGMEEFGKQSALAVRRFAAFSIVSGAIFGLIGALRQGITEFINFDKEFVRLQQVSDASVGSLKALSSTISELSVNLGVSSRDLTTVSVTLAQAGLSIRDTEQALKALAQSALAPSFDNLNETVEGSIALMRQFGISSDQLGVALGSVNAVSKAFAVESADLIAAIQRTGGVFAAASKGVSEGTNALNEFLALFTSVRQTTRESAETIATGLRTIFTRIQRGSTIEALEDFGIQLTDLEGKFVGPFEAVRRLSQGLASLDPRDLRFSKIVEELGGFRQIGKVIPLIQQFAVAQQALKVAQQGTDSLAKDAATAQLALATQLSRVREEFLALVRSIGQSEGFRSLVSLALDLTSGLIKLADAAKGVLPALTAIATIKGLSALTRFGSGFASAVRPTNIAPRGFATGGLVPGSGDSDSVDARLTPGEYVLRKKAVKEIGVQNLTKLNRGGVAVQKFKNRGIAKAPLVDDILSNAPNAILPTPQLAIQKLIKAGGGFVDVDRTLKRTVGDQAYARARTDKEREAVKNKYFLNNSIRLNDIKSAGITQFGKELQNSIKSGKLSGSRVRVISKSPNTPGVAEYLSGIFGIPSRNFVFTGGGNKGPLMRKFAQGGLAVEELDSTQFAGLFARPKGPDSSGKTISVASNRKTSTGQEILGTIGSPASYFIGGADEETFTKDAGNRLAGAVRAISKNLGGPDLPEGDLSEQLVNSIGIEDIAGKIFEGVAKVIAGSFSGKPGDVFDIRKGTVNNTEAFNAMFNANNPNKLPDIDYDAKLSESSKNRASLLNKAIKAGLPSKTGTLVDFADPVSTDQLLNNLNQNKSNPKTIAIAKRRVKELTNANTIKDSIFTPEGGGDLINKRLKEQINLLNARIEKAPIPIAKKNNNGGSIRRFAVGGSTSSDNTIQALLTPGEAVIDPDLAKKIGIAKLDRMNYADKNKTTGFASGGGVGIVPGSGNTDTYGPVPLKAGSYVIRKKATEALGFNRGGSVGIQKFKDGGEASTKTVMDSISGASASQILAAVGATITAALLLKANFATLSTQTIATYKSFRGLNKATTTAAKSATSGGFGGGIGGLIAVLGGSAAIEGVGSSIGGDLGTRVSSMGTSALNYGLLGSTIGSFLLPGIGTLVGGLAGAGFGAIQGIGDSSKIIEEREKAKMDTEAEKIRNQQLKREQDEAKAIEDATTKAQEALVKLAEVSVSLSEVYQRANSRIDRFGASLEDRSRANVGRLSDVGDKAQLGLVSRIDEQVLKNISAFSVKEVLATTNRLSGLLGGGQQGSELAESVLAGKIIQEQLPTLLRETPMGGGEGGQAQVIRQLNKLLEAQLGVKTLSGPTSKIIKQLEDALGQIPDGASLADASENIQQLFGTLREASEQLALNAFTQYNNALDQATGLWNQWIEATEQATEFTIRATEIRLQSELDLQRTLGRSLSLEQEGQPLEQNVRGLTSGLVRGGTTNVDVIGQQLDRLAQENIAREQRIKNLREANPNEQTNVALQAELQALAKNKLAINQGTKALQELAAGGGLAAAALNKISELQQRAGAFGGLVRGLVTADSAERNSFAQQAGAFGLGQRALQAGVGPQAFGNEQFARNFFAGFERFQSLLEPDQAADILEQATVASLQAQGINVDAPIPAFGGRTARELAEIEAGKINEADPLVVAFNEAINLQEVALNELATRSETQANLFVKEIKDLFQDLKTTLPRALIEASQGAQRDADAVRNTRLGNPVDPVAASTGGIVYASKGSLVSQGFKPRGKDTVPAMTTNGQPYMLQPREFIVNADDTAKNYDLLTAINNGENVADMIAPTAPIYAARGGVVSGSMGMGMSALTDDLNQALTGRTPAQQKNYDKAQADKTRKREEFERRFPGKAAAAQKKQEDLRDRRDSGDYRDINRAEAEAREVSSRRKTSSIFGDFLSSQSDSSYQEILDSKNGVVSDSHEIYKDLVARSFRPVGYNLLETNDRSMADAAIEDFMRNYESVASEPARKASENAKVAKAQAESVAKADQEAKKRRAIGLGLVSSDIGDRPLSESESNTLARAETENRDRAVELNFAAGNEALDRQAQDISRRKTEMVQRSDKDLGSRTRINPYTGKPFENAGQEAGVTKRAAFENKSFAQIEAERETGRTAAQTAVARRVKEEQERLVKEQYEKEQAEYEERMRVASKKATEQRRYEQIRFETAEKNKGLGYLAEGLYESTPTRAIGEFGYGLGEVGIGAAVGVLGLASATASTAAGLTSYAADFRGDLSQGLSALKPRQELEDNAIAMGAFNTGREALQGSIAGFSTMGTGFDRIGRALSFDKETMEQAPDSALGVYEAQKLQEMSNKPLLQVPIPDNPLQLFGFGGDEKSGYSFRLPSPREILQGSYFTRDTAFDLATPVPAIPGLSAVGKRVAGAAGALDQTVAQPVGRALQRKGIQQRVADVVSTGTKKVSDVGQNLGARFRAVNDAMTIENAARIRDVRSGTTRLVNPTTGRVERIPDIFADNPEEYFKLFPQAEQRVLGKNFEYGAGLRQEKITTAAQRAEDARAGNIFEEIAVEEERERVRKSLSFSPDGLSPMQQSIVSANATKPATAGSVSASTPRPVSSATPTNYESRLQQAIEDAMRLSDQELEGVTISQIAQQVDIPTKPIVTSSGVPTISFSEPVSNVFDSIPGVKPIPTKPPGTRPLVALRAAEKRGSELRASFESAGLEAPDFSNESLIESGVLPGPRRRPGSRSSVGGTLESTLEQRKAEQIAQRLFDREQMSRGVNTQSSVASGPTPLSQLEEVATPTQGYRNVTFDPKNPMQDAMSVLKTREETLADRVSRGAENLEGATGWKFRLYPSSSGSQEAINAFIQRNKKLVDQAKFLEDKWTIYVGDKKSLDTLTAAAKKEILDTNIGKSIIDSTDLDINQTGIGARFDPENIIENASNPYSKGSLGKEFAKSRRQKTGKDMAEVERINRKKAESEGYRLGEPLFQDEVGLHSGGTGSGGSYKGLPTTRKMARLLDQLDLLKRTGVKDTSAIEKSIAEEYELVKGTFRRIDPSNFYSRGGLVYANKGAMVAYEPKGTDRIPAMLSKGEYVMNNTATANNLPALNYMNNGGIIKPKYMGNGGGPLGSTSSPSTSSSSSFNGSYSVSLEDKSRTFMETFASSLNTFGKDFNAYITELAKIKIPDKIEMVGRHSVEVNVNGAAAFEALEDGVISLINTEIGKKMNMLWNQSNGQLGESTPTGDFNIGTSASQV
jgi:hypothetical protein